MFADLFKVSVLDVVLPVCEVAVRGLPPSDVVDWLVS